MKKPPTLEEQALAAFEASRSAHRTFEAMVVLLEAGSLNIEQIKWVFDLVQKKDQDWLDRESQYRQWESRKGSDLEVDLSAGDPVAVKAALGYLKEMIFYTPELRKVKNEEKELFRLTPYEEKSDQAPKGRYQRFQRADR